MSIIEVATAIQAPPELCFALALSVDLHPVSAGKTREQVVGGVQHGGLTLGDTVTFRARHFGVWQTLTSKITELRAPRYFCDEMQQGAFKSMRHEHHFDPVESGTLMRDVFAFESPLGILGRMANFLVLENYLRAFLAERGAVIKQYAENDAGQQILAAAIH